MGKKRQLTQRIAGLYGQKDVVVQAHGGTNQSGKPTVISQDRIVTKDRIRKPQGLVPLTGNKVALADIDGVGDLLNAIALVGDTEVFTGSINEYFINNHGSDTTYNVSVDYGSAVLSDVDKITYTAPSVLGTANLTVNGNTFTITVSNNRPNKPTFISPVQNALNVGLTQLFTANVMTISGPGTPNHDKSDWQIASDSGFTSISSQTTDDAVNKTSWTGRLTTPNTVYYARVRYHDAVLGWGDWSDTLVFTTKAHFVPSSEVAKLMANDPEAGDRFGDFSYISNEYSPDTITPDGTLVASYSLNRTIGSWDNATAHGAIYLHRKKPSGWEQVRKFELTGTEYEAQLLLNIPAGGLIRVEVLRKDKTLISDTSYSAGQVVNLPVGTGYIDISGKGSPGSYNTANEPTLGANSTAFIGGVTFDFIGGYGETPAKMSSPTRYDLVSSTYFGRSFALGKTQSGDERLAVLVNISYSGKGDDYVNYVYFFKNTGNDNWVVEWRSPAISLVLDHTTMVISDDGNTVFLSEFQARTSILIHVFKYGQGWAYEGVIDKNTPGMSAVVPGDANIGLTISCDSTGDRVAFISTHSEADVNGSSSVIIVAKILGTWRVILNQQLNDPSTRIRGNALRVNSDFTTLTMTTSGGYSEGLVYIFNYQNNSLVFKQLIMSPDGVYGHEEFGYSLDMSSDGEFLLITERVMHPNFNLQQLGLGKGYIYQRDQNGFYQLSATLHADDQVAGDGFGMYGALSPNGQVATISGYCSEQNSIGAVYVFE